MAPVLNDLLDDALKNKTTLPSWKSVFTRLTASPKDASPSLASYLLSPAQLTTLARPHQPFPPPSASSKQSFETKTAAINFDSTDPAGPVPPIKDLKEEALSLSTQLNIDELSALRLVVIEYQTRDAVTLIKTTIASSDDAPGGLFTNNSIVKPSTPDEEDKGKALQRRIAIYLLERRYIIKTTAFLVRATLAKGCAWKHVGKQLLEKMHPVEVPVAIIDTIRKGVVQGGGEIPNWISGKLALDLGDPNALYYEWEKQILYESIHHLQLLFILLYKPIEPNGRTVTAWFKLMKETWFFGRVHTPNFQQMPDVQTLSLYLKPLCSIVSLTILAFNRVDAYLATQFFGSQPVTASGVQFSEDKFYLKSDSTMILITETLMANARNSVSCLTSFCWSMILRRISEYLSELGMEYELGEDEERRAIEGVSPGITETPGSPSITRKEGGNKNAAGSFFCKALGTIYRQFQEGNGVMRELAEASVDGCRLFDVVIQLVTNVGAEGSGGRAWSMGHEEDGKRMKAVLANLVRKATDVVGFGQPILGATLVVTDVALGEAWETGHSPASVVDMALDDPEDAESGPEGSMALVLSALGDRGLSTNVVSHLWSHEDALRKVLIPARARFPYEPLPFLKVIRSLATEGHNTMEVLTKMNTYTQILPLGFDGYEPGSDIGNGFDDEPGLISLWQDLCLFAPRQRVQEGPNGEVNSGDIVLHTGRTGRIISESTNPPVVMWNYEYSALTLFGRILECALMGTSGGGTRVGAGATDELGHREAVMEIIAILTLLLLSATPSTPTIPNSTPNGKKNTTPVSQVDANAILREASDAVANNKDVVSIIFDLLEEELQSANRGAIKDTEFVSTMLQFVDALLGVIPQRVWPYLARSSLLDRYGNSGALVGIASGVEVVKGEYDFTIAALRLFEDMVDEGLKGTVASGVAMGPTAGPTGSSGAIVIRKGNSVVTGVSGSVQKGILEGWTRWGVDLMETYRGWRYLYGGERMEIGTRISTILTKILEAVYGVHDTQDLNTKAASILSSSAEHLVKVFLSDSTNNLPLQPIIGVLQDGVATPESSLYLKPVSQWVDHVTAVMKFATVLVRVRAYIKLPPSQLEIQLYEASPLIAKAYATHSGLRIPAVDLLESMISTPTSAFEGDASALNASRSKTEPPSLLGHLGNEVASSFTQVLATLDSPIHDLALEARVWTLVSAIVSNKQQGMSILILRGETLLAGGFGQATAAVASAKKKKGKSTSILTVALDGLSDIAKLDPERALAMLETVALAQNYWSLAVEDMGKHPRFFPALMSYIQNFSVEFLPADSKEVIAMKSNTVAVMAYIAQIFAMYLHARRANRNESPKFIEQLVSSLKFYFINGVKLDGYRPSLHGNLGKNFEEKFSGLSLLKLKKTKIRRKRYGVDYVYDLDLASKLLSFDPSWDPPKDSMRGAGYKEEVAQANLNLSLFDSQVVLLRAWRLLAIELCNYIPTCKPLGPAFIVVIESCLKNNGSTTWNLPAPIFHLIISERAEFAFVIMRRLQEHLNHPSDPKAAELYDNILDLTWKAIHSQRTEFRRALASGEADYYRSLLRILYMSLLAQASKTKPPPIETCYKVLDMLNLVVAQGFHDLASAAHAHPETSSPQDIALVTAILQAAMSIKGIEVIHAGFASHIADNDTIRAATTLFSWAEQIAERDSPTTTAADPVYADLTTLYLHTLSTIPFLTTQLAQSSVLELLLTSSIAHRIRLLPHGMLNPIHFPRLHSIWARGILPIAINLLTNIGPRIAEEVAGSLRFFAPLVEGVVRSWGQRGNAVTVMAVRECQTLVLAVEILRAMGVGTMDGGVLVVERNNQQTSNTITTSTTNTGTTTTGPTPMAEDEPPTFNPSDQPPSTTLDPPNTNPSSSPTAALNASSDRRGFTLNKPMILEGVEYLLTHRNYLASLVVPTTAEEEAEAALKATPPPSGAKGKEETGGHSALVERVIKEMEVLRDVLVKAGSGGVGELGGEGGDSVMGGA